MPDKQPCTYCGLMFSPIVLREHLERCPQKPVVVDKGEAPVYTCGHPAGKVKS